MLHHCFLNILFEKKIAFATKKQPTLQRVRMPLSAFLSNHTLAVLHFWPVVFAHLPEPFPREGCAASCLSFVLFWAALYSADEHRPLLFFSVKNCRGTTWFDSLCSLACDWRRRWGRKCNVQTDHRKDLKCRRLSNALFGGRYGCGIHFISCPSRI